MNDKQLKKKKQAKSSFQTPLPFLNSFNNSYLTNYDSPPLFLYNLTNYNSSEVNS